MNLEEYQRMHEAEQAMWWYRGLHANLLAFLDQDEATRGGPILDAGCGTGGFLRGLLAAHPELRAIGMDIEPIAAGLARRKSDRPVCVATLNALPFATGSLAAVVSADVLCHRSVDEAAALADCRRVLAPGGVLLLNLPAYRWMMSAHDRAVHTARRYSARGIADTLRAAGFTSIRTSYWNTLPFPLMVLRRKLLATQGETSDVMSYPRLAELLFRRMMALETRLLRGGWRLPFGGSVLVAAIKAAP